MRHKFTISEAEREYFRKHLADVEKISPKSKLVKKAPLKAKISVAKKHLEPVIDRAALVIQEAPLKFHRGGLQTRLWQRFQAAKLPVEAHIDLHHCNQAAAAAAVMEFLQKALQNQQKILLIIHGKGQGSHNQYPVIKKWLLGYLYQHPSVLAYAPAPSHLGGLGATLVMLRKGLQ